MNGIVIDKHQFGMSKNELVARLKVEGIDTRYFFQGMHAQPSLWSYGCDCGGEYGISKWLAENGLHLPSGSNLEPGQIEFIEQSIRRIHG